LSNLAGNFDLFLHDDGVNPAVNTVVFNDQSLTLPTAYTVTDTSITRSVNAGAPMTITFTEFHFVDNVTIYAGTGNDTLGATSTPVGTEVFFNGGNGNETMSLGGGPIANLAGRVFTNGQAGTDQLNITNGPGGGVTNGMLNSGGFTANAGPLHLYLGVETVHIFANDAGSNLDLRAAAVLHGGNGNDSVTVGGGDFNDNIIYSVSFIGAGGFDSLVIDDSNDVAPVGTSISYKFDIITPAHRFLKTTGTIAQGVISTDVEQTEFRGSNDANVINVLDTQTNLRINSNGGNDQINITDATGLVTVNTGSGSDALTVNTDSGTAGDGPVTVVVDASDDISSLDLRAGGTLRVTTGAVLAKTTGTFNFTGTIDLAGGSFLSRAGGLSQPTVRAMILAGRNGGAWNGTSATGAINSSLAATPAKPDGVGYALGSEIPMSTIGPFSIGASDVLLRYTMHGDADLNGVVDFDDYSRIDQGFNNHKTGWVNGDFDYNNVVDFDDYSLIDFAFNTQGLRPSLVRGVIDDGGGERPVASLLA
jgi:hypothetical protein